MAQPQPGYPYVEAPGEKMGAPPPYYPDQHQHQHQQAPPAGFVGVVTSEPVRTTHVIVSGTVPLSHQSQRMTCPHCHADVSSSVDYESGVLTHLIAFGLCIIVCWPCCLIPYCVDGCKDTTHKCPSCRHHIGVAKRL